MTDTVYIEVAMWIIGGLLGLLVLIIGWSVSQMQKKIEDIAIKLGDINNTLTTIEKDLRNEVNNLKQDIVELKFAVRTLHPEFIGFNQ